MRTVTFWIITFFLIGVSVYCSSTTVFGQSSKLQNADDTAYAVLEADCVKSIRETMWEHGYKDCGVNMTGIRDESGKRSYEIVMFHRDLEWLDISAQNRLKKELKNSVYGLENTTITFFFEF